MKLIVTSIFCIIFSSTSYGSDITNNKYLEKPVIQSCIASEMSKSIIETHEIIMSEVKKDIVDESKVIA